VNGSVSGLFRWPVKSMAGEAVDALRVDERGAGGDRTHALWDASRERTLTARQAPGLLRWKASYPDQDGATLDPAAPPEPQITAPDGTVFAWADPALFAALSDDLGFPVVGRRALRGQQDLADSLLLTTPASLDALGEELGEPLDLRRFRTNLHVAFDDLIPYAETGFTGGVVRVGEAWTRALHPCVRCVIPTRDPDTAERSPQILRHLAREHETVFGINLRPLGAATIRVGDPVVVSTGGG
jgi:uncharacterized protein YcbX